ncbi:HYC_CC_PP family protein [Chryseosolibacter indicus]|uniref:Uncharacterized protein n=1 Tax=Chryseosolibacter indicus TaxID=2782351 RepID=A0ABS5VJW0_9BACT|nr:hypothetical protein [Chryseosolibacter indicus]MBT1701713.1 hypothetical protein [Chryseosolibacter indicus]
MALLKTILSTILILLVLISSTSFMVGIHYCGGNIQNVALFTKAEQCDMEKSLPPCHRQLKAACCEDEAIIHNSNDFKGSKVLLNFEAPVSIDVEKPLTFIAEVIPLAPIAQTRYYNYDPPLRSADIIIEHQVFLI